MEKDKKPRLVKRYQNRKLYDTENSCYVTLEDIAGFIQKGEDVVVIDNKTRDDLTSLTLTQIILEEEKRKKNILPLSALKNIIQSGAHLVQKSIQSVSSISHVKEASEKVFDKIKDEIEDGSSFIRDFLTHSHKGIDELSHKLESKVKSLGKLTNAPFLRGEIRAFRKKVAQLERKIRQFEK